MTSGLFYLRCVQIGLSIADTDLLTMGEIFDMITESSNDQTEYDYIAGQDDFDKF